jgi:hypothetical protein
VGRSDRSAATVPGQVPNRQALRQVLGPRGQFERGRVQRKGAARSAALQHTGQVRPKNESRNRRPLRPPPAALLLRPSHLDHRRHLAVDVQLLPWRQPLIQPEPRHKVTCRQNLTLRIRRHLLATATNPPEDRPPDQEPRQIAHTQRHSHWSTSLPTPASVHHQVQPLHRHPASMDPHPITQHEYRQG